jgi:hypothetical protein
VLQVDYAADVLRFVEERFTDVLLVRVRERIFDDAGEETVVMLASGARESGAAVAFRFADVPNLDALERLLATDSPVDQGAEAVARSVVGVPAWKETLLAPETREAFSKVLESTSVRPLSSVARVRLGTVTGANGVFVLTEARARELGVWELTCPVIARSSSVTGTALTTDRLRRDGTDSGMRLLSLPGDFQIVVGSSLEAHLIEAERLNIHLRRHCRRDPWWSLGSVARPDAFLPYTVARPRGIALNMANAASTNTVHQVSWTNSPEDSLKRSWSLTSWSSFGQFCAELYGRHYGGGVLKMELAAANRLPLVDTIPVTESSWNLSEEDPQQARSVADTALLNAGLGLTVRDLEAFRDGAASLAAARVGTVMRLLV